MFFLFDSLVSGVMKGLVSGIDPSRFPELGTKYLSQTELGSIPGLLQRLRDGGLGAEVDSWMGPGANRPVTADQLRTAIGEPAATQLARAIGVSGDQLMTYMAELLPTTVERMSASGTLGPQDGAA